MTKTICFTGSRPKKLCGYDKTKYNDFVQWLKDFILKMYDQGYTRFISGGAQGFDQLAFWAVNLAKQVHPDIQNIVYAPFPKQDRLWLEKGLFSKAEYQLMLKLADEVHYCTDLDTETARKGDTVRALHGRNHEMVKDSNLVIALYADDTWPTASGGTAECMRYVKAQNKPITQLCYEIRPTGLYVANVKEIA